MNIEWQRKAGSGSLKAEAVIGEAAGGIDMVVDAPNSDSHTLHVRWVQEASGGWVMYYLFAVEPRAAGADIRPAYKGAAILRPNDDWSRLSGNYWTDQFSKGHYTLTRATPPTGSDGTPAIGTRKKGWIGMGKALSAVAIAMTIALLIFLLAPLLSLEGTREHRIEGAVTQASRSCQLTFSSMQKRKFESNLVSNLKQIGTKGSTTIEETRSSVNKAFSESGQMTQDERVRECMTQRTNYFLSYEPGQREREATVPAGSEPRAAAATEQSRKGATDSGPATGYVYYEEDEGRLTDDGVFGPPGGTPAPSYDRLQVGEVLRSVRGAELRQTARGDSPTIRKLAAGQCVKVVEKPTAPLANLVEATSGGRIRVQAVSCRSVTMQATTSGG